MKFFSYLRTISYLRHEFLQYFLEILAFINSEPLTSSENQIYQIQFVRSMVFTFWSFKCKYIVFIILVTSVFPARFPWYLSVEQARTKTCYQFCVIFHQELSLTSSDACRMKSKKRSLHCQLPFKCNVLIFLFDVRIEYRIQHSSPLV